jgi:phosphoribosyl 1,2-cyclic phosphate phosphodiesterase
MTAPSTLDFLCLGSGTSHGVPMIGCHCRVCRSTDPRNQRTRCSALVTVGAVTLLIDTSTDLRAQALRHGLDRLDAVFYTHTHADHLHGIDDLRSFTLRQRQPLPVTALAIPSG